ncbi:OB-fold nucleic acid binding domain-containing protein [Paecilomyces variotii No. 5]|uniref:OB-fold nucleic acid binding domain-containing protein n=1 Tax=Byssochlamys spectabilis (strain No. 5 / NBRC 109023) TaxID=1356009 RepID=V5FND3_BYSSN|nr:OB-fold nucleic acid binding domain-containing protein [Paecilomyces variotii No. 5]
MAAADDDVAGLTFYPAFCFRASPTHFAWVKMAVTDVLRLKTKSEFEGQNIYFYYNHPIQFVCLAGIIVARTEYAWRTVLILDDGSGETVEIVVSKATSPDPGNRASENATATRAPATKGAVSATDSHPPGSAMQAEKHHVSSRTKDRIDIADLVPGVVLKVKGTLSTFRSMVQVQLERFTLLRDTNSEMHFWDEQSRFLVDVLSVPWTLEPEEVDQLRREADEEEDRIVRARKRLEQRRRKAARKEQRDKIRIQKRWERDEKLRREEAPGYTETEKKV